MRYVRATIGAALSSLFGACIPAVVAFYAVPAAMTALVPPDTWITTPILPGPLSGWISLWLGFAAALLLVQLPKALRRAYRIAQRSREVDGYVLWRTSGHWELHHPCGGVVPVDGLGIFGNVWPRDLALAQALASLEVEHLTHQAVRRWEPDRTSDKTYEDSSWIARLEREEAGAA